MRKCTQLAQSAGVCGHLPHRLLPVKPHANIVASLRPVPARAPPARLGQTLQRLFPRPCDMLWRCGEEPPQLAEPLWDVIARAGARASVSHRRWTRARLAMCSGQSEASAWCGSRFGNARWGASRRFRSRSGSIDAAAPTSVTAAAAASAPARRLACRNEVLTRSDSEGCRVVQLSVSHTRLAARPPPSLWRVRERECWHGP